MQMRWLHSQRVGGLTLKPSHRAALSSHAMYPCAHVQPVQVQRRHQAVKVPEADSGRSSVRGSPLL